MLRLSGLGQRKKRAFSQGERSSFNQINGFVVRMHNAGTLLPLVVRFAGPRPGAGKGKPGDDPFWERASRAKGCVVALEIRIDGRDTVRKSVFQTSARGSVQDSGRVP